MASLLAAGLGVAKRSIPAPSLDAASAEASTHHHAVGHQGTEGLSLVASSNDAETVSDGPGCDGGAPVREYDIVAIDVDITLNRYLDHDPEGRMYVLESELDRVHDEEARNASARRGEGEPAVTIGLQGDAIQPLTLRANQGDCLRVNLRNTLSNEPASFHLHGSALRVAGTDRPAIATNPDAMAAPGATVSYEWMIPLEEPEGTHDFHSHGHTRDQTVHGLFGALIVEPKDSTYINPTTGGELTSGWSAIVQPPDAPAFREFTLFYHEIGDESYLIRDRNDGLVPQVDPLTSAYRPNGRALNYRSEPFLNRLALQQQSQGSFDESAAYSSYSFGDPATPIMRSYLGDPVKQRIVHGGSEVMHVHHVHGGSIRWHRQPGVEDTGLTLGLQKHPPLIPQSSERTDSQTLGPSETFDVEDECGSGGCQQSAGDFLVHCHVAHHYFAGMWGLWRVYNTMQNGTASTDQLPALLELPDRTGNVKPAVSSDQLLHTSINWSGQQITIGTSADLADIVERQLPPRGVRRGYDASVLDWEKSGDIYLGEPIEASAWPGYDPATKVGERPPLPFDPATGKLAYPFLVPHLGKRPPFAPNHGPAPFLDPTANGADVPPPGSNGPTSLCPDGTQPRSFAVNAITVPVTYNEENRLVDPAGQLFVLREQEDSARADNTLRVPLAIRANAGEDCIDVLLRSELQDSPENKGFAKVNMHIHFVQFDVQASDGVDAGFNYEQSVRPFAIEGQRIVGAVQAGATAITLDEANRFQAGAMVGVGMDQGPTFEAVRIEHIDGNTVALDRPLQFSHGDGEIVSTEFVRYRWYPDVQFGTAYFHDHVNALTSWKHGLYGALVSEPPGSSYHDPDSGEQIKSGPIADVYTDRKVSVDVRGSFREMVLFLQDDSPVSHVGRSTGSAINLRVEPLKGRRGEPARAFNSAVHGDPETPVLRANLGDPIVLRTLVGATNDVHTLHIDGHWFRAEGYSGTSPPIDTISVGISERQDLVIPGAGGPQMMAGDYLYYNGRSFKLEEGSWGLIRVMEPADDGAPLPLPGRNPPLRAEHVCPDDAPSIAFDVAAIEGPPTASRRGKLYVLQQERNAVLDGSRLPTPLSLWASVGDCITVRLENALSESAVTFHADMLAADPLDSAGVEAGRNPEQAIAPGESRTYTFFADPAIGETVALVRDWGDVTKNPGDGLYGAIIIGPHGATYTDPATGEDLAGQSSWRADVHAPEGSPYRDNVLFFQDEDEAIGTHRMPYMTHVDGNVGLNYKSAPLDAPANRPAGAADAFTGSGDGDPPTPLIEAIAGDDVRLHVLAPWSEQSQVFSIEGHAWKLESDLDGSNVIGAQHFGGLEALTIDVKAGGTEALAGDYVYGNHREPYREAGLWGIFRVYPAGDSSGVVPLSATNSSNQRWTLIGGLAASVALICTLGAAFVLLRQRRGGRA